MSLFNSICGYTPHYELLLQALGIQPQFAPSIRFRDCFLDKNLDIVLMTRTGGRNREEYQELIDILRSHALYKKDYDDDFDSTFAYFVFQAPDVIEKTVWQEFYDKTTAVVGTPMERFHRVVSKLNDPAQQSDPEVVKALNVGRNVFDKLATGASTVVVNSDGSVQ